MTTSNSKIPNSIVPQWVRFRSVVYLRDRGLTFGIGTDLFPRTAIAPGKFSLNVDLMPHQNISICDGRLDIFQDSAFDHVVVGPALTLVPDPLGFMKELVGKLKLRGHLVVFMPEKVPFPEARCQFNASQILDLISKTGAWKSKCNITRDGETLIIVKKIPGSKGTIEPESPRSGKRACICRYGALGDMVLITPLIRKLAEDGYEVTMNITQYAAPLLENNPHVSNIILQERDAIPNQDLGPYWDEWRGEYDRYINLSESIEGRLLKVENRKEFYTSKEWREKSCGGMNYQDWTMELGGYPEAKGQRGELFFSRNEILEARKFREDLKGKFIILWGLNGSSHHKVYPLTRPVLDVFLEKHPDVVVVLVGGPEAVGHEFDHPQVIRTAGKWPLRKTMSTIGLGADLVVGPESMVVNVASCFDVPKIVFLSHSNVTNLTKYWSNCTSLKPSLEHAPCYPCHQLHYSLESCPQGRIQNAETGEVYFQGPRCAMGAISGDVVLEALEKAYQAQASEVMVR